MDHPGKLPVYATLSEGWKLFSTGLISVFPWILAAELLSLVGSAGASKNINIMTADFGQYVSLPHLGWELLIGCVQALLYGIAIIRLAELAGQETSPVLRTAMRGILPLLIGYLIYELIMIVGVGVALILFLPTAIFIGRVAGVLVTIIPLAPTAYVSTALALFAFPAVLEKGGPFRALMRSVQLTRSNWGRAAVVISVPAIVLLAIAAADEIPFMEGLRTTLRKLAGNLSGMDAQQLQNLMSGPNMSEAATHPVWWTILFAVLTAVGWWYALAVCYAEYRELNPHPDH